MNKAQLKVLAIVIPAIFAMAFFSRFYTDLYHSLDNTHQIYLSELFVAGITISIFVIRKKFKTNALEPYELLMGGIAAVNLLPPNIFDANWNKKRKIWLEI